MARPEFGKREARPLDRESSRALKVHADYVRKAAPRRSRGARGPTVAERTAVWLSYYTLVFIAIVTFAPGTAVAAIRTASDCAATLL